MPKQIVPIDGIEYEVAVVRNVERDISATRIIIPVYMPTPIAQSIARVCIESIRCNTREPYELWVVDNHSPEGASAWLAEYKDINIIYNRTEPVAPRHRGLRGIAGSLRSSLTKKLRGEPSADPKVGAQAKDGSYANAIGLELGCHTIDAATKNVFTMHSDTLVLKPGWLSFLASKLNERVRAVACWQDELRVRALHIGGLLFDFTLFQSLGMEFHHNIHKSRFPNAPEYDVGDLITMRLHEHGFETYTCANTYNTAALVERIPVDSPLRALHSADRCFDDAGEVFYVHMGRGTQKAFGSYNIPGKLYPEEWVEFAKKFVLRD